MMKKLAVIFLLAIVEFKSAVHTNKRLINVSSLSPPQRNQKIIVSIGDHERATNTAAAPLSYGYNVVDRCPVHTIVKTNSETTPTVGVDEKISDKDENDTECGWNIVDVLLKWNPNGVFPSKSQAKRSLEHGKILLFNCTTSIANASSTRDEEDKEHLEDICISLADLQPHIARITSVVEPPAICVLMEPIPSKTDRYPLSVTKYMFPPMDAIDLVQIIYQDNDLAVVNKPENMTTIGATSDSSGTRSAQRRPDDLQSVLGFLLKPSPFDPAYHPRPVHRLDRRTSGLVLVAKTQSSMRKLSKAFATRVVSKTYSSLVFERDRELSARLRQPIDVSSSSLNEAKEWLLVDYPIENREAISEVRRVTGPISASPSSLLAKEKLPPTSDHNTGHHRDDCHTDIFSIVEVRPKTGRTHQIRRHLSYCLGMPIVGDSKYDKGARHLRTNGMYLCCHSLRFPHTHPADLEDVHISPDAIVNWTNANNDGSSSGHNATRTSLQGQLSIRIPLPSKFQFWMDLELN